MKTIYFRVDASSVIGSGHLMRCLALAEALNYLVEVNCIFISRDLKGNLFSQVEKRGFTLYSLKESRENKKNENDKDVPHASWLEADWLADAQETIEIIKNKKGDWLVVDHYALDNKWEKLVGKYVNKLMVIDDLADRIHFCDLLLDQNYYLDGDTRYQSKVNQGAKVLIGPKFSLLRKEFSESRSSSLMRRRDIEFGIVLICMGAGDLGNETLKALRGVLSFNKRWKHIDIVVSADYLYVEELKLVIKDYKFCQLHVQTNAMASLMRSADFAITAGGSITWEKCSLGLPSLAVVLADNQRELVNNASHVNVLVAIGEGKCLVEADYIQSLGLLDSYQLKAMSKNASELCDGNGAQYVANLLFGEFS